MYIAMNRFKVQNGSEAAFEDIWKNRDSSLSEMKGFKEFHLLRGPVNEAEGYTLFASHTVWASHEEFRRLDQIRELPRRAPQRRLHQGALSRPSTVRGLFGRRGRVSSLRRPMVPLGFCRTIGA